MITLRFFFFYSRIIKLFVGFSFAKLYEFVIITTLDITGRYSRLIKIVNIFSIKCYLLKSLFSLVLVVQELNTHAQTVAVIWVFFITLGLARFIL